MTGSSTERRVIHAVSAVLTLTFRVVAIPEPYICVRMLSTGTGRGGGVKRRAERPGFGELLRRHRPGMRPAENGAGGATRIMVEGQPVIQFGYLPVESAGFGVGGLVEC